MARICQITGKKVMYGNSVSHSNRKTRRTFQVNIFKKKFFLAEEKRWIDLSVSAAGIRMINKLGLKNALEGAKSKGFIVKY